MVSKQTGTIITAVMAVLFGCAGIFTCVSGVLNMGSVLRNFRFSASSFVPGVFAGLGANFCMSLGFIALPVVFYIILVANNKQEPPAAGPEAAPEVKDAPKE